VLPADESQWWAPQRISRDGIPTRHPDIRSFPSFGTFIVGEEETPSGIAIAVHHLAAAGGSNPPQRESDPWGRQRVHQSEVTAGTLNVRIGSVPDSVGTVPMIRWVEGLPGDLLIGEIFFDPESLTWSTPTFTDAP